MSKHEIPVIESTYHGYAGTSSGMPVVVNNVKPAPRPSLLELRYEIAARDRVEGNQELMHYEDWNNSPRNKERFAIGA
jgi:hypothetical protein